MLVINCDTINMLVCWNVPSRTDSHFPEMRKARESEDVEREAGKEM